MTQAFGRVSGWQFMREMDIWPKGPQTRGGPPSVVHKPRRPGGPGVELFTNEEWELLSRASGQYWKTPSPRLEAHFEHYTILGGDNRFRLVKGMEELPGALEGEIRKWTKEECQAKRARIDLNTRVTKVVRDPHATEHPMRVFIVDEHKNERQIPAIGGGEFDYVVCAAPAPAVARIRFEPPLRQEQAEAFSGASDINAAKYLLYLKQRRWENGELEENQGLPIFGGASYTDQLIQQCWYPSDNVRATFDTGRQRGPTWYTHRGRAWPAARQVLLTGGARRPGRVGRTCCPDRCVHDGRKR